MAEIRIAVLADLSKLKDELKRALSVSLSGGFGGGSGGGSVASTSKGEGLIGSLNKRLEQLNKTILEAKTKQELAAAIREKKSVESERGKLMSGAGDKGIIGILGSIFKALFPLGVLLSLKPVTDLLTILTNFVVIGIIKIMEFVKNFFPELGKIFQKLIDGVVGIFTSFWEWVQTIDLSKIITDAFAALGNIGEFIWGIIKDGWEILKNVGQWIWDTILKPAWEVLKNVGQWIWNTILKPAWEFLLNVGEKIWTEILLPAWEFLKEVGLWIWTEILEPAFKWLSDIGSKIWGVIKDTWNWALNIGSKVWEAFKAAAIWTVDLGAKLWAWVKSKLDFGKDKEDLGKYDKHGNYVGDKGKYNEFGEKVDDAIIKPDGTIIRTHPNDTIIATQTPEALMGGGGGTHNLYFYGVTPQEMINVIKRELGTNTLMSTRF